MGTRLELHTILKTLGAQKVYFQPPPDSVMEYPCIRYHRNDVDTSFADNLPYRRKKRYLVTVIDTDPDSPIPDRVGALEACTFEQFYAVDNLNHDVFQLFF